MKSVKKRLMIAGACAALVAGSSLPLAARGHAANYSKPVGIDLASGIYADGSYEGSAVGFMPGLVVEVTVKGGKVSKVEVVDHNEVNSRFYAYPIQVIPQAIVKKQSTDVDAVSGASATSYAIMAAVENALQKASAKSK